MLATFRRLRSLALWVIVCVIGGPAAAALCVHEVPAETPPCHESAVGMEMGGMAMEHSEPDAPQHHESETACLSACCTSLEAPEATAITAPSIVATLVVVEREVWMPVVVTTAPPSGTRAYPPPGPERLEIGRLLI